jgi:hypothetical protein
MKIHAGYKITYDCPQPTPMILQLSVHPSRTPDLLTWDRLQLDPPILANTYHDVFGNFCHVIHAPAGQLTMSADFLVQDKGEPDAVDLRAEQHALQDLPVDTSPSTRSSSSSAADIARRIASSRSHGRNSQIFPEDGALFRRSATTSTIALNLVMSTRVRPKQHGMSIPKGAGYVGTLLISPSRCAAA